MSTDHYFQHGNEINRRARQFLSDCLAEGPQPYQVVYQQAVTQGISKSALLVAKRSLYVESRTRDGYAVWNLPDAA
jgi:hypothetical protein